MAKSRRIPFGKLGRPHGLRGELRFFPYNEDSPVLKTLKQGVLIFDERSHDVQVESIRRKGANFVLKVDAIADRTAASTWTGAELWVDVEIFDEITDEDTYYHWQLVGLDAVDHAGEKVGVVRVVQNYGAGDLLVIRTPRGHVDVPFMDPYVGEIDLEAGRIVVDIHWLDPA